MLNLFQHPHVSKNNLETTTPNSPNLPSRFLFAPNARASFNRG